VYFLYGGAQGVWDLECIEQHVEVIPRQHLNLVLVALGLRGMLPTMWFLEWLLWTCSLITIDWIWRSVKRFAVQSMILPGGG